MKYRIGFKILALLLAVLALTVTVASSFGIVAVAEQNLYSVEYDQWVKQFYEIRTATLARSVAESYAVRHLSNLSERDLDAIDWGNTHEELSYMWNIDPQGWTYSIYTAGAFAANGILLEEAHRMDVADIGCYTHRLKAEYPVDVKETEDWAQRQEYWVGEGRRVMYLQFRESPEYDVKIWITPGSIESFSGISLELYAVLAHFKYHFIWVAVLGFLLTVACVVYLCFAAGKSPEKEGVQLGGLNRLPLDVYWVGLGTVLVFLFWCFVEVAEERLFFKTDFFTFGCVLSGGLALMAALCVVAAIYALAAQCKMGKDYVWKHSLLGKICGLLWKFGKRCFKGIRRLYDLLPLIWKYLLIAFLMAVLPMACAFMCMVNHGFARAFWMLIFMGSVAADIFLVCYGAYAYGTVLKGARTMAQGDLKASIDTQYLQGSYKACAQDLNALADVAVEAAKKQMRSERMKAELVTNVSHDIKTPLTSVINYIDLLQKAENEEQTRQYLEVLDRQSHKLKKLIDDLMDMSKASTGNMAVEITSLDAAEAVNQALGEFADRLEAQSLSVVLRKPEQPVMILADGRLLWRVLHNLMNNVVKYALPGTRVYADVEALAGKVRISLKNISREELNISAEELTERFVRGDTSRNTEGSGLGLNIAKSFMQLQKGEMEVAIDGDLFKVTLIFQTE